MNDTVIIFCVFFFCVQSSGMSRQSGCAIQCTNYKIPQLEGSMQPAFFRSLFYISWIWCMCLLISVSVVCCKKCGCQWHLFASIQWLNSLWRRNSSSVLVTLVSEGGWHEVQMNMTYIPEHVKTFYMLQIQWLITWLMMMKVSTKKLQVTTWSDMSCSFQIRRPELYGWPAGLWKVVDC